MKLRKLLNVAMLRGVFMSLSLPRLAWFVRASICTILLVLGVSSQGFSALYSITDLGTLGGKESFALDLNNLGQVVGYSTLLDEAVHHPFLFDHGVMSDLGTLGGIQSYAMGINEAGLIVGQSDLSNGQARGFRWQAGLGMTPIGTLGGNFSGAVAVNSSGQIVGLSRTNNILPEHAFLLQNDSMSDLGLLPGGTFSVAVDINNFGQVVGQALTAPGGSRAFLWKSDTGMVDLGNLGNGPGYNSNIAWRINDAGQVVGGAGTPSGVRAFLWQTGIGMVDLGTLGGDASIAYGINSFGVIVGESHIGGFVPHAFIYRDGLMEDLNFFIPQGTGWDLRTARAINDSGQIIGAGFINGQSHAFLLNQVPEPSAWLLMVSGLVALTAWQRARVASRL